MGLSVTEPSFLSPGGRWCEVTDYYKMSILICRLSCLVYFWGCEKKIKKIECLVFSPKRGLLGNFIIDNYKEEGTEMQKLMSNLPFNGLKQVWWLLQSNEITILGEKRTPWLNSFCPYSSRCILAFAWLLPNLQSAFKKQINILMIFSSNYKANILITRW